MNNVLKLGKENKAADSVAFHTNHKSLHVFFSHFEQKWD